LGDRRRWKGAQKCVTSPTKIRGLQNAANAAKFFRLQRPYQLCEGQDVRAGKPAIAAAANADV
jgi:starvation-inducible outer membrane lipoprotein